MHCFIIWCSSQENWFINYLQVTEQRPSISLLIVSLLQTCSTELRASLEFFHMKSIKTCVKICSKIITFCAVFLDAHLTACIVYYFLLKGWEKISSKNKYKIKLFTTKYIVCIDDGIVSRIKYMFKQGWQTYKWNELKE